jgi:hypothetical protein
LSADRFDNAARRFRRGNGQDHRRERRDRAGERRWRGGASWSFRKILEHWAHKHAKAVYVPSKRRTEPRWQYAYGHKVRLAQRTDSLRLLRAFASGAVYYDPGIKLENASTDRPKHKKRSQFRVASRNITALYESVETLEV